MTLLARVLFLLVSWPPVFCHYGAGWDATHTGTQIWSVRCNAEEQDCMTKAVDMMEKLDVLDQSDSGMEVVVPFDQLNETKAYLWELKLQYTVLVEDLAQQLKEQHEEEMMQKAGRISREICVPGACPKPLLEDYMSFQQVQWFLLDLMKTYPKQVRAVPVGVSVEGKSLWLVTVQLDNTVGVRQESSSGHRIGLRKAIFVEGGAHGREWISPATTLYILKKQADDCAVGKDCTHVYFFMPLVNPDGYEYTRETDRMWRKNRSKPPSGGKPCYGINLNRNWAYKWGGYSSSSLPCNNNYRGTEALSAPEVIAEAAAIQVVMIAPIYDLILYISYQSFGQKVLYPWGYSFTAVTDDDRELRKGAIAYSGSLFPSYNKTYEVDKSSGVYPEAGTSLDYIKNLGVKYTYTIKLRDRGVKGVRLPTSEIRPTVEENWVGFKSLVEHANNNGGSLLSHCAK